MGGVLLMQKLMTASPTAAPYSLIDCQSR